MKFFAEIDIMPHLDLPNPQGKTIGRSLKNIHMDDIEEVVVGKHIALTVEAVSEEEAREKVDAACRQLLANRITETYSFFIHQEENRSSEEGNSGE
jgi:phosphoribosylformylglycinamidine synthase PurS subunit